VSIWLRTLAMILAAFFRRKLDVFGVSQLRFRVMPDDLDFNIHMNNGRYLAIMDIGRTDLILRTGMWRVLLQNHWQPVLAGSLVRFRRPLKPFQRFELTSHLLFWDEKWLYIEHRIAANGTLASASIVRAAFVGAGGLIPAAQLAQALGHSGASPALPLWVAAWRDAERALDSDPQLASAA
jgi:acyl-CoA thioesterase FadM